MTQEQRLTAFEAMLTAVMTQHAQTEEKMRALRAQGRERTATYRQLMGQKLQLAQMMETYRVFGLIE